MIVVFGATGRVGRAVVAGLCAGGNRVRAVSRSPEAARRVLPPGTEVVRADLGEPRSVAGAVAGSEAVLVLSPHAPDQHELQAGLVDAARRAGVDRVVKLSALDAAVSPRSPSPVGVLHWRTEKHLRDSGLPWAVVRPTPFMQNTTDWLASGVRFGRLLLPMGRAGVALVDAADVAAVLVAALVGEAPTGRIYVVTGPRSLTLTEVAAELGLATGQHLRYRPVPSRVAAAMQRRRGLDPWLVEHQRTMAGLIASGAAAGLTSTVQDVTGRPPRELGEVLGAMLRYRATPRDTRPAPAGLPTAPAG